MTKQKGETNDILLFDRKLFGDEEEHFYEGKFYDGVALLNRGKDEAEASPEKLILLYPVRDTLTKAQEDKVRTYCGLTADDRIMCHDIALTYGEVMNPKIPVAAYLTK